MSLTKGLSFARSTYSVSTSPFAFVRCFSSDKLFDKILIANRGEIACRIMRTCKRLGIKTVAVYSDADARSMHTEMADEKVHVGPPPTSQSYLKLENILEAVKKSGAQAVHPGYGFLSENWRFSDALAKMGVKFIGPTAFSMQALGDKIASKQLAMKSKVNVVPGFAGEIADDAQLLKIAHEIGYPVMVKASGGGGGKGMRVAWNDDEAKAFYKLCKAEAKSSFGDDRIFIEKYIEEPRHIEFQVLADRNGDAVYVNERECSIQRRHQKVIEEAPSVFLDAATRARMGEQAILIAKAAKYENAGTCEFLVDKHRNFYFLEMNCRLQVEHPVTEMVTGVDLVEEMIRVAAGYPLRLKQKDIKINGHALEARVYAEDPNRDFMPSIGRLRRCSQPSGEGVRLDTGIREGDEISIHYDPMISKLLTWGKDRNEAIERMRTALDSFVVRGVTHNIGFLRTLLDVPRFISGQLSTHFLPQEFPQGFAHALSTTDPKVLVSSALITYTKTLLAKMTLSGQNEDFNRQTYIKNKLKNLIVKSAGKEYHISVSTVVFQPEGSVKLAWSDNGATTEVVGDFEKGQEIFNAVVSDQKYIVQVVQPMIAEPKFTLQIKGRDVKVEVWTPREYELLLHMPVVDNVDSSKQIKSPMPGAVVSISVKKGDVVTAGQEVAVIEAMKMQNSLPALQSGKVKAVYVSAGDTVEADKILIELE